MVKPVALCSINEQCPCCHKIAQKIISVPAITGTRDGFGIRNEFRNEEGKTIDNWKSWEKAGYRKASEAIKNPEMKNKVKEKVHRKTRKPVLVGG